MNVFLMHRDRDFDVARPLPWNHKALIQDLELGTLVRVMAGEDKFLTDIAWRTVLAGVEGDSDAILYRQNVLADCLRNPVVVRQLYAVAVEAIDRERGDFWLRSSKTPTSILLRSTSALKMFADMLERVRRLAEAHAGGFASEAFARFFAMTRKELDEGYLAVVRDHLEKLEFRGGVLISAELGPGNKAAHYILREPPGKQGWIERLFGHHLPTHTIRLHPRDEAGAQAVSEINSKGVNLVANALAQSSDHILGFFQALRAELAFYVGCLNLSDTLASKGEPVCFPVPAPAAERRFNAKGLYDVCLALRVPRRIVGNDPEADGRDLLVVTGANQGGKSTFLRSVGLAHLMMQSGMFVPAEAFAASGRTGVFTHYKREEDAEMESGKLDEELLRMSEIVDHIGPDALLLLNESFAATNEREGSEIARQIVDGMLERGVRLVFVTHLYELAGSLFDRGMANALFLRADREEDGTRPFRLVEGRPLQTSYGEDLYREVFGDEAAPAAPSA